METRDKGVNYHLIKLKFKHGLQILCKRKILTCLDDLSPSQGQYNMRYNFKNHELEDFLPIYHTMKHYYKKKEIIFNVPESRKEQVLTLLDDLAI
jgi:hypothetical protein